MLQGLAQCTLMSNQHGYGVGISSCWDKEDLPLLLDQMCFLSLNSLQKCSIRIPVSGLVPYTYSHLQAPYRLWNRRVVGMDVLTLWAGVGLINLEVSKFVVFHFMLNGSDSRGLAQLNFSYSIAKRRKTSVRQSSLDRLSFLV